MIRVAKPKNARSKRAAEKREAREYEAGKTAIFVKGPHSSAKLNIALTELNLLKKPDTISFNKKNEALPFEDVSSFEFWSGKNDASLFMFGNSQKKRPDNLTWLRMFDGQLLDMLEMGVVEAKSMREFKGAKPGIGMRPLFHFNGPQFTTPTDPSTSMLAGAEGTQHDPTGAYQQFKSMLLDFYRGEELQKNLIALSGLQHVICVTAAPGADDAPSNADDADPNQGSTLADLYKAAGLQPNGTMLTGATSSVVVSPANTLVHFRVYTVQMLASGSKVPRVELQECGPSFDFMLRRRKPASIDMLTQALRRPRTEQEKNRQGKEGNKKNIETDDMGDTMGRVHVGKQDLTSLQTRKMKGLKKHLDPTADSDDDEDMDDDDDDDDDEVVYGEDDASEDDLEMEDMTLPDGEDEDEDEDEDDEEVDDDEEEEVVQQAPQKRRRA